MFKLPSRKCGYFWWRVFRLYSVTFLVILPLLCNRLKFSVYYGVIWPRNVTQETLNLREENDQRLLLARQHLESTVNKEEMPEKSKYASPTNVTEIVITIVTVSRKTTIPGSETYNPRYLTQIVSKLIELLRRHSNTLSFKYGLMVCNVDNFSEGHEEMSELSSLVHTVVKYKNGPKLQLNKFEKERQDYIYCGEQSLLYKPKYVLLMEDDAYPTNRMLSVLEHSIHNIFEGKVSEFPGQNKKVAYLKLYHPERLLGFISAEFYRLFELAGAVLMLLTTFAALNRKGIPKMYKPWRTTLVAGIYLILLALAVGRQNLLGLRRISKHLHSFVPAPSCCPPANLYSYSGATAMLSSLAGKVSDNGRAKDVLLDEFLTECDCKAVYVEPNIFKHIGQYSSLRPAVILDPYVV